VKRADSNRAAVYQLVHSTLPEWSLKTKGLAAKFRQVFENKGVTVWVIGDSFDFVILSHKLLIIKYLHELPRAWLPASRRLVLREFYLVFENTGLIGVIRASSLKNKDLRFHSQTVCAWSSCSLKHPSVRAELRCNSLNSTLRTTLARLRVSGTDWYLTGGF